MQRYFLSLLIAVYSFVKADWELAVSVGDRVELLSPEGATLWTQGRGLTSHMDCLALDSLDGYLLVADNYHPNTSIFSLQLDPPDSPSQANYAPKPLVNRVSRLVQGVAFDSVSSVLFWTTGFDRHIMKLAVTVTATSSSASPSQVLHSFNDEVPHGIAVDSCRRQLYWTNCNLSGPSIEASGLDGTGRRMVVGDSLFQPVGLALSQGDGWLYWSDERAGVYFSIERVRVDGSQREMLVHAEHQQPFSLAVIPGRSVYWTDLMNQAVWRVDLNKSSEEYPLAQPVLVKKFLGGSVPRGLVSLKQDDPLDADECYNFERIKNQVGTWNNPLVPCPDSYCLNGGTCSPGQDKPVCKCAQGFLGVRCEYQARICSAFCLDLTSITNENLYTDCRCGEVAPGVLRTLPSAVSASSWKLVSTGLLALCALLLLVVTALAIKMRSLSKRPKLRRRYTGSKKTGPGLGPGAHCEIEIENCCNMNICETPCYEPELCTPKAGGKKEEKRSLIEAAQEAVPTPPCAAVPVLF